MNRLELLNRITTKIRQSLELQTVLDTAVGEIRAFLNSDRVKIYRFDEDINGQVIAESLDSDRLPSLLGLHFPAGDIPPQTLELFVKAKVRSIVNLERGKMSLSEPNHWSSLPVNQLTMEEVSQQPLNNLLERPIDPCHIEYLSAMGVKSTLVLPLLCQKKLWGLLISHHSRSQKISASKLQLIQIIAEQLEIAIAQANLFNKFQQKAAREALINEVANLLHAPGENAQVLSKILAKIVPAFKGTGGLLCMNDNLKAEINCYQYGSLPNLEQSDWSRVYSLATSKKRAKAIDDLTTEPSIQTLLPTFKRHQLSGLLLMPLNYKTENLGNLAIFRQEIEIEKLWAGCSQTDPRQSLPRQSFQAWKELKQGQIHPWTDNELELIESLGDDLSIAVMQDKLYRQERKQRLLVEMRNQELDDARRSVEQASLLKSRFIATSSHELRTPLSSILNYLKLLKGEFYDDSQELAEYIDIAHQSAENLHNIVDDVLDIAKIEAGKMEVNLTEIELEPLFIEQRNLFKSNCMEQDIQLNINCRAKFAYGDRLKVKQVLTNLLNNAFKFTPQGKINLESNEKEHTVAISISDTGIGIEPEKQTNIFDPFVQEDSSIRRHYGGTGLGLTICKQLVELMEGEITLNSEGHNLGTQVTFILPKQQR